MASLPVSSATPPGRDEEPLGRYRGSSVSTQYCLQTKGTPEQKVGFDGLATLKTIDPRAAIYEAFELPASRVLEHLTLRINDVYKELITHEEAYYRGMSPAGETKPEYKSAGLEEGLLSELEQLLDRYCWCLCP